jgi:hypothetical protein
VVKNKTIIKEGLFMFPYLRHLVTALAIGLASASLHAGSIVAVSSRAEGQFLERTQLLDPTNPANFGKPFLHVIAEATGVGSHVGRFVHRSDYLLHLGFVGGELYILGEGTWVETTPNGDTSYGTFTVQRPVNSNVAEFAYVVEGGTGRFEDTNGFGTGISVTADDGIHFTQESHGVYSKPGK